MVGGKRNLVEHFAAPAAVYDEQYCSIAHYQIDDATTRFLQMSDIDSRRPVMRNREVVRRPFPVFRCASGCDIFTGQPPGFMHSQKAIAPTVKDHPKARSISRDMKDEMFSRRHPCPGGISLNHGYLPLL